MIPSPPGAIECRLMDEIFLGDAPVTKVTATLREPRYRDERGFRARLAPPAGARRGPDPLPH